MQRIAVRRRVTRIDPSVQNGTRTVDVTLEGDPQPDLEVGGAQLDAVAGRRDLDPRQRRVGQPPGSDAAERLEVPQQVLCGGVQFHLGVLGREE